MAKDEEVKEYVRRAQEGDADALVWLHKKYEKFVYQKARSMANGPNNVYGFDDYASVGMIGLMKAIKTFDIMQDVVVLTYVARCVTNEMYMLWRKAHRVRQEVSMETSIAVRDKTLTIEDTLACDDPAALDKLIKQDDLLTGLALILSFREGRWAKFLCRHMLHGETQREAGESAGFSQSYASRVIKRFQRYARAYLTRVERGGLPVMGKINMEDVKSRIRELLLCGKSYEEIIQVLGPIVSAENGVPIRVSNAAVGRATRSLLGDKAPEKTRRSTPRRVASPPPVTTPATPVQPTFTYQVGMPELTAYDAQAQLEKAASLVALLPDKKFNIVIQLSAI